MYDRSESLIPLLLLPGLDATGRLYEAFSSALPARYPLRALYYPTDQALDYDGLLPLVRACAPTEGPWALIGESFSGPLAIRLAAERPPGLMALVLCATFVGAPLPLPAWTVRTGLFRLPPPRWLMRRLMFDAEAPADEVDAFMAAVTSVDAPVMAVRARAALGAGVGELLTGLDLPVLYLRAGGDRLFCASVQAAVRRHRPEIEVVTIEGAPHLVLQRRAHEAAAAVSQWLDTCRPNAVARGA